MSQAAIQAHDAWVGLMESLMTPLSQRYHRAWNESTQETAGYGHLGKHNDFTDTLMGATVRCEVFVARPDTVDLIEGLAVSVPYHPVLNAEDVPVDCGFLYLPRPLSVRMPVDDGSGPEFLTARIHAFVWHPTELAIIDGVVDDEDAPRTTGRAFVVYALARGDDELDEFNQKTRAAGVRVPLWMVSGTRVLPADQSLGDLFKDRILSEKNWGGALGGYNRWMLTWWSLLREQMRGMVTVESEQMPRSARRRLERLAEGKINPERAKVKVVDLRRRGAAVRKDGETSSVDWSSRWMVRPHWRRQWYPSTNEHRLKLIAPYIKGPADKPLVVKPTVYDVRPPGA